MVSSMKNNCHVQTFKGSGPREKLWESTKAIAIFQIDQHYSLITYVEKFQNIAKCYFIDAQCFHKLAQSDLACYTLKILKFKRLPLCYAYLHDIPFHDSISSRGGTKISVDHLTSTDFYFNTFCEIQSMTPLGMES